MGRRKKEQPEEEDHWISTLKLAAEGRYPIENLREFSGDQLRDHLLALSGDGTQLGGNVCKLTDEVRAMVDRVHQRMQTDINRLDIAAREIAVWQAKHKARNRKTDRSLIEQVRRLKKEGLTDEKVAEKLNISLSAVRWRKRKAKELGISIPNVRRRKRTAAGK